ncbi:MAG: NAD(P)/FAD-dependent oxidoreductase [Candidatus Magasanikbacteria bacterium]
MKEINNFDVAVIGGGPAGMMAAGTAAQSGARVILIEKNKQLGKKLLLTGNGRCNLTNAEFDLKKLVENYDRAGKFLFHAFFVFGPQKTIEFFNRLGVKIKTEGCKRVFPVSEKSLEVLSVLKKYLLDNGVVVITNSPVKEIIFEDNKIKELITASQKVAANKYIFCTGGVSYPITGSTGDGLGWAKNAGHTISSLSPALAPIKIKDDWIKNLTGLVLNDVRISVYQNNKKYFQTRGDILCTHFGLSGPVVLDISKKIGELLSQGNVRLILDLYPDLTLENLDKKIQEAVSENSKKLTKNLLADFVPARLAVVVSRRLNISVVKSVGDITKKERRAIAEFLKNIEVAADELLGFDLAMVTKGGVLLAEIDDKTMKSKIVSNLFFAGEIIDVDGKTGGFNLQNCWSTGYLAGKSAASCE